MDIVSVLIQMQRVPSSVDGTVLTNPNKKFCRFLPLIIFVEIARCWILAKAVGVHNPNVVVFHDFDFITIA